MVKLVFTHRRYTIEGFNADRSCGICMQSDYEDDSCNCRQSSRFDKHCRSRGIVFGYFHLVYSCARIVENPSNNKKGKNDIQCNG